MFGRSNFRAIASSFGSAVALCALTAVLFAPTAAAQIVRGVVVDSVTGAPLVGVQVALLNDANITVKAGLTDQAGLFLLRADSSGVVRLSARREGYKVSEFPPFELHGTENYTYMLLLPSVNASEQYAEVLQKVCPGMRNGGVIYGWVRDGRTRKPLDDTVVRVSWANVPTFLSDQVSVGEFSGEARADSTGLYSVCGVPSATRVWMHADGNSGHSDFTNLAFGEGTVTTGGTTMEAAGNLWRQDFLVLPDSERTTAITGVVTLAPNHEPVNGATVEVMGTRFSTETDASGTFTFAHLPAGPARLVVRRIGNERIQREIFLPREGTLEFSEGELELGAAQVLDPLIVETTPGHNPLAEFNRRRDVGVGNFITREEFSQMGSPATPVDVLRRLPGIRVTSGGDLNHQWVISMSRGGPRTFPSVSDAERTGATNTDLDAVNPCPPLVFLDRHFIGNVNQIDVDGAIPLVTVEAVETHQSAASLPNEFNRPGSSCGVIAFWTRFAETQTMEVSDQERAHRSLLETTGFHLFFAASMVVLIFLGLGKSIHF